MGEGRGTAPAEGLGMYDRVREVKNMIRIAEFSRGDNPNDTGTGKPGDQLKSALAAQEPTFVGELSIRKLEDSGRWEKVYRPTSAAKAEKLADAAEATCRNVNVGYSWYADRVTFWQQLAAAGYNPAKITTPCNGDCSAGVAAWANVAGISIDPNMTTRNEDELLLKSRQFMRLPFMGAKYLHRGDVLWRSGHTAVVIDSGEYFDRCAPMIGIASSWCRTLPVTRSDPKVYPDTVVRKYDKIWISAGADGRWAIRSDLVNSWISTTYLKPLYPRKATATVRVRDLPTLDSETLDILHAGDIVCGTGGSIHDSRGVLWYEVLTLDRQAVGWSSSKYMI